MYKAFFTFSEALQEYELAHFDEEQRWESSQAIATASKLLTSRQRYKIFGFFVANKTLHICIRRSGCRVERLRRHLKAYIAGITKCDIFAAEIVGAYCLRKLFIPARFRQCFRR